MGAQCRHKPEVCADLASNIRTWIAGHPHESVSARILVALDSFFTDPGQEYLSADPSPTETEQAYRLRTNDLTLPGDWTLGLRENHRKLRTLVSNELADFLSMGQRVEGSKAILNDKLRTLGMYDAETMAVAQCGHRRAVQDIQWECAAVSF